LQDALFQWSKGEYTGASNKEDDLAILSKNLPFKKYDIPTSKPLVIRNGAEVSAADNRGLIETNTDSDTFTFSTAGGRAMLTVDRLEFVGGAYLDVEAQIQNAGGMMLARSNEMVSRKAVLDVMLPAGTYNLIVKGGAEGTPMNGFSSYSSLGYYGIAGTINAATGGGLGVDAGAGAGLDAGAGGAPDADSSRDAGARDTGAGTADAPAPASDGGGIDAGSGGATGGTGGTGGSGGSSPGSGGRGGTRGAGGSAGTGSNPPPTETPRGPVYGGCAVSPGSGAPAPAGTALLLLAAVLVGARRRRR
jgi:MYXO-CTERM domain-containing protein